MRPQADKTSEGDSFKSPDTVYTPRFILTRHSFESRPWSRETAGRGTGKRTSKHAARDCADNTLLLNEKLKNDVKTVDLAAKQIQTEICAVITQTALQKRIQHCTFTYEDGRTNYESRNAFNPLKSQVKSRPPFASIILISPYSPR